MITIGFCDADSEISRFYYMILWHSIELFQNYVLNAFVCIGSAMMVTVQMRIWLGLSIISNFGFDNHKSCIKWV